MIKMFKRAATPNHEQKAVRPDTCADLPLIKADIGCVQKPAKEGSKPSFEVLDLMGPGPRPFDLCSVQISDR